MTGSAPRSTSAIFLVSVRDQIRLRPTGRCGMMDAVNDKERR